MTTSLDPVPGLGETGDAEDAIDGVDGVDALAGWRLRPGVALTPLSNGLHLRGWRSSVTIEGSRALPALWQLLEAVLRTGDPTALEAPTGSPLRGALNTLIGHLHAHDLLVARDGCAARWLSAAAPHPAAAARAIAAARPRLRAGDPADPLAQAAARALRRAGAVPCVAAWPAGPAGLLLLSAGPGRSATVAAGVSGGGGFVTAVGSPEQAEADAAALTTRLGLVADDGSGTTAGPAASAALTALVAGAAAQRLLCAVAGLPDPAHDGEDHLVLSGLPAVLVAEARPLRADYHAWLGPQALDHDRRAPLPPPDTLAQALRRVAALGDKRVGVLTPALPDALPQLPVALVSAQLPLSGSEGTLLAAAARTDLARLDAACRVAELRLSDPHSRITVGATPDHAWGRALRREAAHHLGDHLGDRLPSRSWDDHPHARHWWRTLTERLGQSAELTVHQYGAAYVASVRTVGRPPIRAVEASAGDAVAFAALGAVAHAVSRRHNLTFHRFSLPSGASAPLAIADLELAGWEDEGWTTGWLAGLAAREGALRTALCRQTGLRPTPWRPVGADAATLSAALHACGFTVLSSTSNADQAAKPAEEVYS